MSQPLLPARRPLPDVSGKNVNFEPSAIIARTHHDACAWLKGWRYAHIMAAVVAMDIGQITESVIGSREGSVSVIYAATSGEGLDQVMAHGDGGCLGTVGGVELVEDAGHMGL